MRKHLALFLALFLVLSSSSAFAAGKLNVLQENYHTIDGYSTYGYAYAKVENKGDKPIRVNAGVLELYDEAGEVITSTDFLSAHYAYLQPGEYTYTMMYDEIEGAANGVVVSDYMQTLTGKSDSSYTYNRFPCTASFELNVTSGWLTHNYMYATVTNNTEEPVYDIKVVFALLDDDGNILHVASDALYGAALTPNSSMIFRSEISSSFIDYYEAKGLKPTTVDAIAYTENYN